MSAAAAADSSPPLTATAAAADDYCSSANSPSSTIVGKVDRGCYNVRVDGYSKIRESTRNGAYIESTDFVVGGQPWRICYYPNGNNESNAGLVSIYVTRVGGVDVGLHADVQIDLVARHGEAAPAAPATEFASRYRHTFWPDSSFGFPRFVSTENLEKSRCIKDDGLTIRCDITVEGPPFVVAVKPSALSWHLGDLLGDTETADVAVDVGGGQETFAAHRYVLAARSLVFKAELFGPMKVDKGAAIRVDDMHADAFRAFLHFIYTDELPPGEIDGDDDASSIMAQHLLVAADKYDLPRLKLICENKLSNRLDVGTAATTLALAEQHGCHDLKEVVLRFIKLPSNMEAVKCSDGFKHLLESCPSLHQDLKSRHILS